MESTLTDLLCSRCGQSLDADRPQNLCPCGGVLLPRYDLERAARTFTSASLARRERGMWRYREVLPVRDQNNFIDLGEGSTPLRSLRIGSSLGFSNLRIKDESLQPTGSFKARGMAAAVSRMRELGIRRAVVPTAGNAGIALAAYAAGGGVSARVVVPRDAPTAFVRAYRLHGAEVVEVDGTISDAGKAAARMVADEGLFDVSTLKEPYRVEGKKTMGYELWEALDPLPDAIIYPTGGGTGLVGMWKAFDELEAMGLLATGRRPRMIAVQATRCAPVVDAFHSGASVVTPPTEPSTIAAGLRVPGPYAGPEVLAVLRASKGTAIAVDDDAIVAATHRLAREEGLAMSPEAGATVAALAPLLAAGAIERDEHIVLFMTGSAAMYLDVL